MIRAALLSLAVACGGWYATSDGYRLCYAQGPAHVPLTWPSPDPCCPEGPPLTALNWRSLKYRAALRALNFFTRARFVDLGLLRHPARLVVRWASAAVAAVSDDEVARLIRLIPIHYANIPTLVQCTNSASEGAGTTSERNLFVNLPHDTQAGNCLVLYVQSGETHAWTVTDDKSNAGWTQVTTTTHSQVLYVFVCPNVAAATRKVTLTAAADISFNQAGLFEYCNIATSLPVDTSAAGAGGAGTAVAVTLTTGTAGDLVWQVACQTSSNGWQGASITGDASSELEHADTGDGSASQAVVQAASGSITSTLTFSPSLGDNVSIAVALKSAAAGSPTPQGVVRTRRRQFYSILHGSADITSIVVQMPTANGSVVVYGTHSYAANTSDHSVVSISDQGSNNFFVAAAATHTTGAANRVDSSIWYSPNASATTPIATVAMANGVEEFTSSLYEILGLDPQSPLGATYTNTGSESTIDGTSFTAGTITPRRTGSIVIAVLPIDTGTVQSTSSPSTGAFDGWCSTIFTGGFNRLEEDNGHGAQISDGTTQTWTWGYKVPAGQNLGPWSVVLVELTPPGPPGLLYGVGFQTTHRPGPFRPGMGR